MDMTSRNLLAIQCIGYRCQNGGMTGVITKARQQDALIQPIWTRLTANLITHSIMLESSVVIDTYPASVSAVSLPNDLTLILSEFLNAVNDK